MREFWADHLGDRERHVLFVLGRGFDPRMCMALRVLIEAGGSGHRDVIALDFREGAASPSLLHQGLVDANWSALQALVQGRGQVTTRPIEFWSTEGRRVSSQNARDLFVSAESFGGYTDVVIDISAMPRSVFFPLIARTLYLLDGLRSAAAPPTNLHLLVADDPALDAEIREEGVDEKAEFVASFGGGFDEEAIQTPKVWIPLLGERRTTQFERIHDLVKPDEVCPVLPSPSRNPRRGDDIVVEYQRVLFDELRVDPAEFLYASEQNPFEVYRQLRGAVVRYQEVFRLLGGCRVALSAMSSKLMSLGALFVAYELKQLGHSIGVAHIECQGYKMPATKPDPEIFGLWVTGECDAA
ncbi:MAG: hypothetical protein U0836_27565 [Pirellulales bacterium]